jgi:hypothetical protein
MEHFREWAGSIASAYLTQGTEPTTSLTKIAQSEDLTPEQVQLLAGEANKLIHQHKYANDESKYHAAHFPLADATAVIAGLQVDGGSQKIAMAMPDPVFSDKNPSPFEMFGVEPELMDKTAGVKRELRQRSEKVAFDKQRAGDAVYKAEVACLAAERAFIKEARQVVLSGGSGPERTSLLGTVYHMTKAAGMADLARPALGKLAHVLKGEGLVEPRLGNQVVEFFLTKTADQKAPQELISGFLPAEVVNGEHPLYITLKTYHGYSAALNLHRERYQTIDDRLHIMGQKIRAL